MSLLKEFRRRHVGRAAAVYVAVAWGATEILTFLFEKIPVFPVWADTVVAILFVLGFPVAMFLAWIFDLGPEGVIRTDPGSATGRISILGSLVLLAAATTGLSFLLIPRLPEEARSTGEGNDSGTPQRVHEAAASAVAPSNSVAVLPFENLSDSQETAFFADGVSEEILNGLARVRELRVAARTSAFSFRDSSEDLRSVATALGVRHLVDGSLRRAGDRLRVTARLVDAETGFQLWSETFEGSVSDVFNFQDDIAEGVATALGRVLNMPGLGPQAHPSGMTVNPDAYDDYLLARQLWRQRNEESIRRSIELLDEAVSADPGFAAAWTALASAYLTLPVYAEDTPGAWGKAEEAAFQALSLDETQAEAHAVLGSLSDNRDSWITAEARYERARELAPNNPTIRLWSSELFAKVGYLDRALEQSRIALELDPLYAPAIGNAGHHFAGQNRLEEARALFQRAWDLGLHAMFVWFGAFYVDLMEGDFDSAEARLMDRPIPYGIEADRALLTALRNPSVEARDRAVQATLEAAQAGMGVREVVQYLGALEAVDEAFDLMDDAVRNGWRSTESLWSVWGAPIREDTRFSDLARALGLMEFWQLYGPPDACAIDLGRLVCSR